jgi:transcriptional regulator with XRE-family HTH domain
VTFSQFIRCKRIAANLTQDDIARVLNFSHRSSVHRLESDKIEWKLIHIQALADLFGLTLGQLMNEYESLKGGDDG